MKKMYLFQAWTVGVAFFWSVAVANATLITVAEWTFETSPPADVSNTAIYPNPIAPDVGLGNLSGVHANAGTDWTTPAGNGSAESFSANDWSIGDYFEFEVSTLGLQGIFVSWDQYRSATGPTTFDFQYSTDGSSFTTFLENYTVPSATWDSHSLDLSAISAIENQASVFFRITADSSPGGSSGTGRLDNFWVQATVPEPSMAALLALGGLWLRWGWRRRKTA